MSASWAPVIAAWLTRVQPSFADQLARALHLSRTNPAWTACGGRQIINWDGVPRLDVWLAESGAEARTSFRLPVNTTMASVRAMWLREISELHRAAEWTDLDDAKLGAWIREQRDRPEPSLLLINAGLSESAFQPGQSNRAFLRSMYRAVRRDHPERTALACLARSAQIAFRCLAAHTLRQLSKALARTAQRVAVRVPRIPDQS